MTSKVNPQQVYAPAIHAYHVRHCARCALITIFLSCLSLVFAVRASFAETKQFVAFSMKGAKARIENAIRTGEDFRKDQLDVYHLGGITKPLAVVLDKDNGDWIIVGERDVNSAILTLDDWTVALRARFLYAGRDPGVTIDPQKSNPSIKSDSPESYKSATIQKVRFFGGIENTHFGEVCYEADWLMKRVGLGLEKLDVDKLQIYFDLLLKEEAITHSTSFAASRFWFYPIINRVNVLGDVILLEKFKMGVLTEVLYAEVDGKPLADPSNFQDHASEGFSRSFSDNYDAAAKSAEVLETLRGLTRLAGLAKGLVQAEDKPDLRFWLWSYPVPKVNTPETVDIVRVEDHAHHLRVFGGVELAALATRLKGGDARALKELVLKTRPAINAVSWHFALEVKDDQPVAVIVPPALADRDRVIALRDHAWFLYQKKHYAEALEGLNAAYEASPELAAEAYWEKAVVTREYGLATALDPNSTLGLGDARVREAILLFQKGIDFNPNYAAGYFELGVTYGALGDHQNAVVSLERTLALDRDFAPASFKLGVEYAQLGNEGMAMTYLKAYLAKEPSGTFADDARAMLNRIEERHSTSAKLTASKIKHYNNDELKLAFDYPADWVVLNRSQVAQKAKGLITDSSPNLVLAVGNPDDWDQNATIQIVRRNGAEGVMSDSQLNDLADMLDRRMPLQLPDFTKVSHRVVKIHGAPALEYTALSTRLSVWMEAKEYIISIEGKALIITLTAKKDIFSNIDDKCFQTIINTVIWKEPQ
jgi:tetratricopeptide (TPR) repeat protein